MEMKINWNHCKQLRYGRWKRFKRLYNTQSGLIYWRYVIKYILRYMNNWEGSDLRYKICVDVLLHQTCNRKMWAMSKLRDTQRRCFHVICSFLYARKRDVLRKGRSAKKDRLRLRSIAFLSFDSPRRRFLMNLLTSLSDAIHLSSKFAIIPAKDILSRINSNTIFLW